MPNILVHTMQYAGGPVTSDIVLPHYHDADFAAYKRVYENCFFDMRKALGIYPAMACDTRANLRQKAEHIFLYKKEDELVGSVAIYGNEIDDLIVASVHQGKGYGRMLLTFAIAHLQKRDVFPAFLRVAEWNHRAISLYLANGFHSIERQIVVSP